jgi:hypothetical protein
MASAGPSDLAHLLELVRTWPPDLQVALARRILETMEPLPAASEQRGTPRGKPVQELIGIGAGGGPPPADEEVRQWIDEHRMEKFGR